MLTAVGFSSSCSCLLATRIRLLAPRIKCLLLPSLDLDPRPGCGHGTQFCSSAVPYSAHLHHVAVGKGCTVVGMDESCIMLLDTQQRHACHAEADIQGACEGSAYSRPDLRPGNRLRGCVPWQVCLRLGASAQSIWSTRARPQL